MAVSKAKAGLPTFQPVSDDVLDQLAVDLANILRIKTLEADISAGKLLVDRAYQGSLDLFNCRNAGDNSMKRVATRMPHLGYPLGVVELTRFVKMYEQELAFGPISRWVNLPPSHLWLVQNKKLSFADQADLLQEANDKALNRDQFQALIAKRLGGKPQRSAPSALDNVYRELSGVLDALRNREDWCGELRQGKVIEDDVSLLDGIFERVTFEIETAILTLADRGAKVPPKRRDALRKHIEDYTARVAKTAQALMGKPAR